MPSHVQLLNHLSESMRGEMEVSWHFVDYDSTFNQTTFLAVYSLDCFVIDLIGVLTSVLEIGSFLHLVVI